MKKILQKIRQKYFAGLFQMDLKTGLFVKQFKEKRSMKTKTEMYCQECEHHFKKTIGPNTYEVKCPKCHGYDTIPSDFFYVPPKKTNN